MSDPTQFEVRKDLPSSPTASSGRRGGSKYDAFVDAVLLAAGRGPDGKLLYAPDPNHPATPDSLVDPDAVANPRWVKYPQSFDQRDKAYSQAGNISQQVFPRRNLPMKLATSVQMAVETTAAGESVVVYHAWLRVNPTSTTSQPETS